MRRPIPKLASEILHRKAAAVARESREETAVPGDLELASVVQELRIHQIELELQNEELQEARQQAEELQGRYFRHFDLAPVGMFRLNARGIVLEANILGAAMLGVERIRLHSGKVVFTVHVAHGSQATFHAHLRNALASPRMESCGISLRTAAGTETYVRMQSVRSRGDADTTNLLVTLIDHTALRNAEKATETLNAELERRVRERTALLDVAYKKLEGTINERRELEGEILAIGEREQRRIGQDLHDDLCQRLAGIALLSGVLAKKLKEEGSGPNAMKADEMAGLLQSCAVCARDIARGLHPVEMDGEGLAAALQDLAARANEKVNCRFEKNTPASIANHAVALSLYRIAQEAVTNALKHAEATEIVISLDLIKGLLVLSVSDNGIGLPKEPPNAKSMGRHIMAYRAAAIGATLWFEKRPGGGTQVICSLQADQPTNRPTDQPTNRPTDQPANRPTGQPANRLRGK